MKYPIYIVSKGRADIPITANMFLKAGVPFFICVEPQEVEDYKKTIPQEFIKALPFSNLGVGSYPARNFAWEDAKRQGYKRHFLFDDNIRQFYRLNNGKRTPGIDPKEALECLETFTDRYQNAAISAFNYLYFAMRDTKRPFSVNTHCYSAMLIDNSIPFRWRLKYNEDVDLCLQVLNTKELCTVLLNAYLVDKVSTVVKLKGGNQSELYKGNDPLKKQLKAKSLEQVWPQYAKTTVRFGRPHHSVAWGKHFKQPLKRYLEQRAE